MSKSPKTIATINFKGGVGKTTVTDLRMIAHEVGLTFASKPSKKLLISRIRSRINESMLLSKNVNVTQPRSAQVVIK